MSSPLRVLYALWHYPHLSESYVRTEIRAVRASLFGISCFMVETVLHVKKQKRCFFNINLFQVHAR
jgi:hypothetical protein